MRQTCGDIAVVQTKKEIATVAGTLAASHKLDVLEECQIIAPEVIKKHQLCMASSSNLLFCPFTAECSFEVESPKAFQSPGKSHSANLIFGQHPSEHIAKLWFALWKRSFADLRSCYEVHLGVLKDLRMFSHKVDEDAHCPHPRSQPTNVVTNFVPSRPSVLGSIITMFSMYFAKRRGSSILESGDRTFQSGIQL